MSRTGNSDLSDAAAGSVSRDAGDDVRVKNGEAGSGGATADAVSRDAGDYAHVANSEAGRGGAPISSVSRDAGDDAQGMNNEAGTSGAAGSDQSMAGASGASEADAGGPDSGGMGNGDCDSSAPFLSIEPLPRPFQSGADEDGIAFGGDGLTAYFSSRRHAPSDYDIYVAARTSPHDDFRSAELLDGQVNTDGFERQPSITPNELKLFYSDNTYTYLATRTALDAPFSPGKLLTTVEVAAFTEPFVTADERFLYFTSSSRDIYYASFTGDGLGAAHPLKTLSRPDLDEGAPVLTNDQLTLYSQRGTPPNIWVARRETVEDDFSEPTLVQELSSSAAEYPEAISSNKCTIYFVRGNPYYYDLFKATRAP